MSNSAELTELANAHTAGELITCIAQVLSRAELFYGHGTDNPQDEAVALVFHVLGLDYQAGAEACAVVPDQQQRQALQKLLARRVHERHPLPYLLGEAWFAGRTFNVSRDVLIPRSPIAELIADDFSPWLDAQRLQRVLEIGTGSGCIAVACALALPHARVVATDISMAALGIAASNIARHDVSSRVELVCTDLAAGIQDRFDLIISNPPYVPAEEMAELPPEYNHEPSLGLVSGSDGLDSARRILQDAPRLLAPHGALVLEVGAQWQALEQAFPRLPFTWLEFARGGIGVALLYASDFESIEGNPAAGS